uniref:Sulfhydryl oxidase n=1 Tax=Trichuris muris TaxID=70415 RepID=A0A5S6QM51_TRIMR
MNSEKKPCRVCFDFREWLRKSAQAKVAADKRDADIQPPSTSAEEQHPVDCPLDKDALGRSTWSFLHTLAAYLPEKLDSNAKRDLEELMRLLSLYYPCDYCASDLRAQLVKDPPVTSSPQAFAHWLCQLHNVINKRLGKPLFDCTKVNERWRDGWSDGSCN